MKKAAILWSSPNRDGLTASAKDAILKGLTDAGTRALLLRHPCAGYVDTRSTAGQVRGVSFDAWPKLDYHIETAVLLLSDNDKMFLALEPPGSFFRFPAVFVILL